MSQPRIKITCTVVFDDESTQPVAVSSLSMRGAQREITSWLISQGYEPAGRWKDQDGDRAGQTGYSRRFRPVSELREALNAVQPRPGEIHEAIRNAGGR